MPTKPPSVLIVTRTFPPDPAAVGQLVADLAMELATRGCRVGIATTTADPGKVSNIAGVEVSRVAPWFAFTRESTSKRALSYLSILPALLLAARALPGKWDFVVTTSDPPLQVLLGPVLRAVTKARRVVQWSQDLYPEIAEELGVLARRGTVANFLRSLSNWGLRHSDLVIVPGRCMASRLRARGLAGESIHVVPNWSAPTREAPIDRAQNPFRREHGLDGGQFVVMYSGNLGLAHTFDVILAAAERLKASTPEIVFFVIGDGPRATSVREEAGRRGLVNMRFLSLQPRERLAENLGAADLHLVTMRERLAGLVVPSKFYGVIAAGRPCVFIGPEESEIALAIREGGCGVVTGEGDADALVQAILNYASDANAREQAGVRSREQAANYSVAASADKFLTVWQMIGPRGGEPV